MEEFSTPIGLKIFNSVFVFIIAGASFFLFNNANAGIWATVLPIGLLIGALFNAVGQVKSKILVSADNIVSITAFGRKELSTANVKGCRIDDKSITIEPTSAAYQKIIIGGYKNLGNSEDLVAWLTTNFSDLDDLDLKEEQDELTHDQRIGSTELEREEKLAKTKRIALAYNITGGLVGIAGLVFKNEYMLIGLLTYPLIGILLLKLNNGIIKFVSNRKKSFLSFRNDN